MVDFCNFVTTNASASFWAALGIFGLFFSLTYGHTGFPLYFDTWFFEKQYEFAPANLHHQVEKFLVLLIDAKISKSKIMRNI